jgi:DNA-binding phage protein
MGKFSFVYSEGIKMTKKMTAKKRKKSPQKSTTNKLQAWSPTDDILLNPKVMSDGLSAALAEGDQEVFLAILHGWISTLHLKFSMDELVKMTGISRRALYNLRKDDANPTAETIMSLARAVKRVA